MSAHIDSSLWVSKSVACPLGSGVFFFFVFRLGRLGRLGRLADAFSEVSIVSYLGADIMAHGLRATNMYN